MMRSLLRIKQIFAGLCLLLLVSACTTGGIEQDLTPAPTPQTSVQNETSAQPSQPVPETALAAETPSTPAGNVANTQVQEPTAQPEQQVASLDTGNAVTFLPFEGAPASKTGSLTRALNVSGQSTGLAILPATRSGAKYKVKGYFSALNDGTGTMLVYVWDVVDASGKRLHRINGRERSNITRTDPWQAITDKELERVAADTTSRLKTWVDQR